MTRRLVEAAAICVGGVAGLLLDLLERLEAWTTPVVQPKRWPGTDGFSVESIWLETNEHIDRLLREGYLDADE